MSAGKNAIPLAQDVENPPDLGFTCQDENCGYRGKAGELLVEPDNTTMYCPQCGNANWWWD